MQQHSAPLRYSDFILSKSRPSSRAYKSNIYIILQQVQRNVKKGREKDGLQAWAPRLVVRVGNKNAFVFVAVPRSLSPNEVRTKFIIGLSQLHTKYSVRRQLRANGLLQARLQSS